VLSFPAEVPPEVASALLGDIVICAPVCCEKPLPRENRRLRTGRTLVAHGVLHLLGYDHDEAQAEAMESLEIRILAGLGYADPYGDIPKTLMNDERSEPSHKSWLERLSFALMGEPKDRDAN
jgi:probable rRNA maturation factor